MMDKHSFFTKMIDEIVEFAQYNDPELLDGIKWLDMQAQKEGVSFYDKAFDVLYKHNINSKAQDWMQSRN